MALFKNEPKFVVVDSAPLPDSRKLDPGETGSVTTFSITPKVSFFGFHIRGGYSENTRRIEVIKDDCTQTIQRNREVIIRYQDEPKGVHHRVYRSHIKPDQMPLPDGRLQAVKSIGKYGIKEDAFLPTFTRDEQHTTARPLTPRYAASELARNPRNFWVYRDLIYSTAELFSPEEITALILDAEKRKKTKVERALQKSSHESPETPERRHPIPDDVKMFVWKRDEGKCVKCGGNRSLEFDHIIPWSMGGSDTARNLQLLCEVCNRTKGGNLA